MYMGSAKERNFENSIVYVFVQLVEDIICHSRTVYIFEDIGS